MAHDEGPDERPTADRRGGDDAGGVPGPGPDTDDETPDADDPDADADDPDADDPDADADDPDADPDGDADSDPDADADDPDPEAITEEVRNQYYRKKLRERAGPDETVDLNYRGLVETGSDPVAVSGVAYEFVVASANADGELAERVSAGDAAYLSLETAFTALADAGERIEVRFGEALEYGECELLDHRNEYDTDLVTVRCSELPEPVELGLSEAVPADHDEEYGTEEPVHLLNSYVENDCRYAEGNVVGPVDKEGDEVTYEVAVESLLADLPPSTLHYAFDVEGEAFDRLVRASGGDPNHLPGFRVAVYPAFVPSYTTVDYLGTNGGSGVWRLALVEEIETASQSLTTRFSNWLRSRLS